MRLATIISAWADSLELLPYCIHNHLQFADSVIVVWSETSNHKVKDARMKDFVYKHDFANVIFHQLEPVNYHYPLDSEMRKRNTGLDVARSHGFTHFLLADADEFYEADEVEKEKERFVKEKPLQGLVCGLKVYIKHPTLCTVDPTLIPFIHTLTSKSKVVKNPYYPFAYDRKKAVMDPGRRLNVLDGVEWSKVVMHHMSYVRIDINQKINNSTATNLRKHRDLIDHDLKNAAPGVMSLWYKHEIAECDNKFNLPIW